MNKLVMPLALAALLVSSASFAQAPITVEYQPLILEYQPGSSEQPPAGAELVWDDIQKKFFWFNWKSPSGSKGHHTEWSDQWHCIVHATWKNGKPCHGVK